MATTANEPAFSAGVPENGFYYPGLTKRELFAMAAMQGLMFFWGKDGHERDHAEAVARKAVRMADALLAELSKPQP